MARGMKKRMENKRILRGVDEKDSSFSSPFIFGVPKLVQVLWHGGILD